MAYLKAAVLLSAICLLGGCGNLRGARLLMPETFGLRPVAPDLYVEAGAHEGTDRILRDAVARAERAVADTYGSVVSRPVVHACVTASCYRAFGGGTSRAKAYGDRILLSPAALNWHFVAHEWSHAEMLARLTFAAWRRLPQWFDEGVAVALSDAPEHSEAHWASLVEAGIPHPARAELRTYRSLSRWLAAVQRYGETQNAARRASGEPEIHPVYAAAGHELRPWLAQAGRDGLRGFIERLNRGEDFDAAYAASTAAAALPRK